MNRTHSLQLSYKNCWHAPGYRDLRLVLVDPKTGNEYELYLPPRDVQRVIFDCADAAKQINDHPPLDWEQWQAQLIWPAVTPWMRGPPKAKPEPAAQAGDLS